MPSVLRIGPRAAHEGRTEPSLCIASRLRSAILSHFAENGERSGDGSGNVMTITNKYFSAEVAVEFLSAEEKGGPLGNEDGVCLVFDARGASSTGAPSDPSLSFDSLTSVHDAAVASGQAGDLLRLCVGVGLDGPVPPPVDKASEEEYSRRVLWCLDRGYEYVEADLSAEGVRRGHGEREKEGFARVAEAVGGTVWSGATMKPRKAAQLRRTFDSAERGLRRAAAEDSSTVPSTKEKEERAPRPEAGAQSPSNASDSDREKLELKNRAEEVLRLNPPENLESDDPGDQSIFNDLDNVLQQAAAVRAAAKSGELSDEERRQRAGDVAMMLAGLMGNMDFDESDEDRKTASDDEGGA